ARLTLVLGFLFIVLKLFSYFSAHCDQTHAKFNDCGSGCPITCANRHNHPVCDRKCYQNCYCVKGYLEDSKGICCVNESVCERISA
uniref:TIL domain-containing protein n=1 Tax=Leptobrachium leishanense TaxID=445787 RepID=A0A8C5Q3K2_9ANUR